VKLRGSEIAKLIGGGLASLAPMLGAEPDDGALRPADVGVLNLAVTAAGDRGVVDVPEASVVPFLASLTSEGRAATVRTRARVVGVDGLAV
jgi:hypothetical protein